MYSRRTMLRLGGVATAATLAGCAAPRAEPSARRSEAGIPDGGDPVYRRWLPAADATPNASEFDSATVRYVDVDAALDRGGALPPTVAASAFEFWSTGDWFGHELADVEGVLAIDTDPQTIVYPGDVSVADAGAALEDGGYDARETDDDWELYVDEDRLRAVGVAESGVVQAAVAEQSNDALEDGTERIRAVFAANAGEVQRLHEADPHLEELTDLLGRGIRTTIGLERPEWLPAGGQWGTAIDAADGEYVRRASVVTPDEETDRDDELAEHFEGLWDVEPTVYSDGGRADAYATDSIENPVGNVTDAIAPRATIDFEYDEDDQRGTVTHRAGESLDLSRLAIAVDGLTTDELGFDGGTFDASDQFAIGGLPADVTVELRYELVAGVMGTIERFVAADGSATDAPADEPIEEPGE